MKRQRALPINNVEDDGVCRGPVYNMSYLPGSARPAIDFPISTGLSVASAFVCFQRGIACAREGSAAAAGGWRSPRTCRCLAVTLHVTGSQGLPRSSELSFFLGGIAVPAASGSEN